MDESDSQQIRKINSRYQALLQSCTQRKPILKNGTALDPDSLFLARLFSDHIESLLSDFRNHSDSYLSGGAGSERVFILTISHFKMGVNLLLRHLNDSVSPLARRSDETSLVMLLIALNDCCALEQLLRRALPSLRASREGMAGAAGATKAVERSLSDLILYVEAKIALSFPCVLKRIESGLYAKIASTVAGIVANTCDGAYFQPKADINMVLTLAEGIDKGCLEPLAGTVEKYSDGGTSAQRAMTVTVASTVDTIIGEIIRNALKLNERGVYLLYLQLNWIAAWILKTKMRFGFAVKSPFLINKTAVDDMNYCLSVLQTALNRGRDSRSICGSSCFPVLKYNFSNVVAPDPSWHPEEGKSSYEHAGHTSMYHKRLKTSLEDLVLFKQDNNFLGCLFSSSDRGRGGAAKILCSAPRVSTDGV